MAVVISKEHPGKGISSKMINNLKKLAKSYGYSNLIFPVRPTLKSQYPAISMDNYINWEKDNLPFELWLRVYIMIGGEISKVANSSIII